MKKKSVSIVLIILTAVFLFIMYILFLAKNKHYDFIPFILGAFTVFAIYFVKNVGNKPQEWNSNQSNDISPIDKK